MALLTPQAGALAARTSVARLFPVYDNRGLPDLTLDPQRFVSQMSIVDRYFEPGDCSLYEYSVGGDGYRRILRFDAVVLNGGDGDLVVGDPSDPNNPYRDGLDFSECHGHFHVTGFSAYELLTLDGTLVAAGQKQDFCFEDSLKYDGVQNGSYDCGYQGITSGWADQDDKLLGGQWIDITGVPEGDYVVRVRINAAGMFNEGNDIYPNAVETLVHIPSPRKKVSTT